MDTNEQWCCYTPSGYMPEEHMQRTFERWPRQPLLWLGVCLLVSLLVLIYPVYVIRPFRYQGASELALALGILRFRPPILIALSAAALFLLAACWMRNGRRWQKVLSTVCAGLVAVIAVLSRINIYEVMFHALDRPSFSRAISSKLDGGEEVIAVQVNGESRAYPIRSMSYHHIVNDVVGGQPIVATY